MLRRCAVLLASVVLATAVGGARAEDRSVGDLISALKARPQTPRSPVALSAVATVDGHALHLNFHMINVSARVLSFDPDHLPWGGPASITWVALTKDGRALPLSYPIWDVFAPGDAVLLQPGHTLDGSYNLDWMLHIGTVPADTDLAIVWLYRVPDTRHPKGPEPMCSGVAWLHTPK